MQEKTAFGYMSNAHSRYHGDKELPRDSSGRRQDVAKADEWIDNKGLEKWQDGREDHPSKMFICFRLMLKRAGLVEK